MFATIFLRFKGKVLQLNSFSGFDIMIRASILLGIVLMTFSHFVLIIRNRKANEEMETLKFYNSFWIQKAPTISTYICSILLGLSMVRVGSILKVNMSSTPSLAMFGITVVTPEQLLDFHNMILIMGAIGGVLFVASGIFYNTAQLQLGKNYSLNVDIKEGYRLKVDELYGVVRHPIYLGEIMMWLSASLALLSWTLLIWTLLVHIPLYINRIKGEEELLEHYWNDKYTRYKENTGRLLPVISKKTIKR